MIILMIVCQLSANEHHILLLVSNKTKRKLLWKNLPEQMNPSPEYPARQVQVKLPGVLVQLACELHPPLFTAHSSTSVSQQQWLVYHGSAVAKQC